MKTHVIVMMVLSQMISGCATMSNRTKAIVGMIGAGLVVGTIAANRAPEDENAAAVGALYGGTAAAVAGVVGLFAFDEQARSNELDRKLNISQRELDAFRGESQSGGGQVLVESDSALGRDLPNEYKGLVRPGKWSLYKISNWVSQGENTLVHQDKVLRIEPPQFQPQTIEKKEGE